MADMFGALVGNARSTLYFDLLKRTLDDLSSDPKKSEETVTELIGDMLRVAQNNTMTNSTPTYDDYDEGTVYGALVEALPLCIDMKNREIGRRVFSVLKSVLSLACAIPERAFLRCRLSARLVQCLEKATWKDDADVAEITLTWKEELEREASSCPNITERDLQSNIMFGKTKNDFATFYLFDALVLGHVRVVHVLAKNGADPRRYLSDMYTTDFYDNGISEICRKTCEEYGWCTKRG